MFKHLLPALLVAATLLAPAAAPAQAVPATHEMIQALRPAATRNLLIRARPAEGADAPGDAAASAPTGPTGPSPSLSLAIQFELNSAQVRPESGAVLGNLVAAMLSPELKGSRFLIEGHTDARGSAEANQRLSQERAEQVRLYLVALGVSPARLRAQGKGANEPVNALDPLAPENRRVRVVTVE